MIMLNDFKNQDLTTQIQVLESLKQRKPSDALADLLELYQHPLDDSAVDFMVSLTLREIVSQNESTALEGLSHKDLRIRKLHVQVCGQKKFQSSALLLAKMVDDPRNEPIMTELFDAMSQIQSPEFIGIFNRFSQYKDDTVAAMAIEMIGIYSAANAFDILSNIVEQAETDENYKICRLTTGAAIEALGKIQNEQSLSYLAKKIHHRNPTARQIIHKEMIKSGEKAVPILAGMLENSDQDIKIMTCNILGRIGHKKGGEVMIEASDKGHATHPNVKYALYEALGNIPFMKGIIFLIDGLKEQDDLILTAVIESLDKQLNPGVIQRIKQMIDAGDEQAQRIIKAIITTAALKIFEALYEDPQLAPILVKAISQSNDPDTITQFKTHLSGMQNPQAQKDAQNLKSACSNVFDKKVLAVDDSKAMLAFYRKTLSDMGISVTTAENGKEALDLIESGQTFDLILTDMNMPVMNGIEFTRQLKQNPVHHPTPIIMITTESDHSQKNLAVESGVDGFLSKPFTSEGLQNKINAFC